MDFLQALKKRKAEGPFPVIPDIKCFSPKEGDLIRGRDPAALAEQLEAAGIPAGMVRMSCGLEDKEDLIADLRQALEAI